MRRRPSSRVQWKVPYRTICTTELKPFGVRSSDAQRKLPAALLIELVGRPELGLDAIERLATASGSRTSQGTAAAVPPASRIAATVSSSGCGPPPEHRDARAEARHAQRHRAAEPGAAAGDDGGLAREQVRPERIEGHGMTGSPSIAT